MPRDIYWSELNLHSTVQHDHIMTTGIEQAVDEWMTRFTRDYILIPRPCLQEHKRQPSHIVLTANDQDRAYSPPVTRSKKYAKCTCAFLALDAFRTWARRFFPPQCMIRIIYSFLPFSDLSFITGRAFSRMRVSEPQSSRMWSLVVHVHHAIQQIQMLWRCRRERSRTADLQARRQLRRRSR